MTAKTFLPPSPDDFSCCCVEESDAFGNFRLIVVPIRLVFNRERHLEVEVVLVSCKLFQDFGNSDLSLTMHNVTIQGAVVSSSNVLEVETDEATFQFFDTFEWIESKN